MKLNFAILLFPTLLVSKTSATAIDPSGIVDNPASKLAISQCDSPTTESCLPPWQTALKWCQDHPESNKCPWLPWSLSPQTIESDGGHALRTGLKWGLNATCLLSPDACSSFKVDDVMNMLSKMDWRAVVQALQNNLGARCEASPKLCPYVPLTMDYILSAAEEISDFSRLVQAVLAGAEHEKKHGRPAPPRSSGQPITEHNPKAAPAGIIRWYRRIMDVLCEKKSYPWCPHLPELFEFVEDMFQSQREGSQDAVQPGTDNE
ncbi:hypothetical protein LX32DRAFT_163012 [Colletotrichum zoysiae]|uniref:Uncharacterized protein n=1 Tax=Colletotrichum zoysiae TaxID=1216348 RepID=A0AAD9H616_9PEZI|nr:hypothetical protein LX32DRAFT_163012 [Colletotrichum zoysiae]